MRGLVYVRSRGWKKWLGLFGGRGRRCRCSSVGFFFRFVVVRRSGFVRSGSFVGVYIGVVGLGRIVLGVFLGFRFLVRMKVCKDISIYRYVGFVSIVKFVFVRGLR